MYGGPPVLDYMMIATPPHDDPKVQRFMPHFEIDAMTRPRKWWPAADQTFPQFAADAARIQKGGGLVGIGSHGEFQGLGYHWEMQAYAAGGLTPHDVLKAATIGSSEIIGHAADIGSLEPGKFADILIMESNPLADIRNTLSLSQVMKNGRLYDASSLDEIWPRQAALSPFWFWDAGERAAPVRH